MKRVVAVFVAALGVSASVPQDSKSAISWAKSWSDAVAEATIRNVPIFFTVHKDGWGECTVEERAALPNAAVVTASKNMVCVVGHAGAKGWDTTHGSKEIKQGTEKVKVCKIYPNIVCSDHVDIFKERAGAVFGDKVFATPHHLYYTPTGEEMFRNAGAKTAQELAKDFADALSKVTGTHVSKDEYEAAKTELAKGAAHVKKDEIKKAIEVFTKMSNHRNVQLQPMGKKELDALSAGGDARYNTALQTLETANGEEQAKKELKKIADEYAPLPCSKKAAEILKLMAEKGR